MKKDKWMVVTRNSEEDWVIAQTVTGSREHIVDYVKAETFKIASYDLYNVKTFSFGDTNEKEIFSSSINFEEYRMLVTAIKDTSEEAPEELQFLTFADNANIKVIATFEDVADMGEELYNAYIKGNEKNKEGKTPVCVADGYRFVTVNGKILLLEEV